MEYMVQKQIIEEKDKIITIVKKELAEGKSTSSTITVCKDKIILQK
jgi:hypothetical protein